MSNFTKGEWKYEKGDGNYWTIQSVQAEQIGDCINEANARLIAAAPEMYEILKRIDTAQDNYEVAAAESEISALLARIDGEEAK